MKFGVTNGFSSLVEVREILEPEIAALAATRITDEYILAMQEAVDLIGEHELSLIQGLSPDRLLGRVNATLEVLSHGIAYPIGALAAAVVAGAIGVRGGMAVGWAGMAVSILFLVLSPLPGIRTIADERAAL